MAKRKGDGLQVVGLEVVFVVEDVIMGGTRCSKKSRMGLEVEIEFGRGCDICSIELKC